MSLRTAAEKVDARPQNPKCTVAKIRLELDDLDKKFLNDLLGSNKTSVYIAEVLKEAGKEIQSDSVQRHRRRECTCAE